MASLARTSGGVRADARPALVVATKPGGAARLERAHETLLSDAEPRVHPFLKASHRTALSAFEGGARSDAADRIAVGLYVAGVVASLAAEGELDATDAEIAVDTLAESRGEPVEAARFDLHRMVCASPLLLELPPLVACEIQLRLLVQLGIASEASLWRPDEGNVVPVLAHR